VLSQADSEQTMPFGSVGRNEKGATGPAPMNLEREKKISFHTGKREAAQSRSKTLAVAKSDGEWQHLAFRFEPPT